MNVQSRIQIVAACFGAALAALLSAHRADAGTVYDNLGQSSNTWIYGDTGDRLAQPFQLGANDTVTSARLRLVRYEFPPSGTLAVEIWDDDGSGIPNSPVGTLGTIPADLGLGPCCLFDPHTFNVTFDDPVTGLNPGSQYHLILSYLDATADITHALAWTTVQPPTGTDGAGEALGLGPVSGPQWVNISSFVGDSRYNYFQMTVTAVPEPASCALAALACVGLLCFGRRSRCRRLPFRLT